MSETSTSSDYPLTHSLCSPTKRILHSHQIERNLERYHILRIKTLKDTYTEPISCREDWWRTQLRETPVPGSYEIDDFLAEESKKPTQLSYNFKNEGRKKDGMRQAKGELLLPGEFNHKDFLTDLRKKRVTYNFKTVERGKHDFTKMTRDKDVNVCPNKYPMEQYMSLTVVKTPSKHMVFRSQVPRSLPTVASECPPVGTYDPRSPSPSPRPLSSMFRSKTPRFRTAHTKVPGPGTYDQTYQSPMPATIARMGRQHGLFFQAQFQV